MLADGVEHVLGVQRAATVVDVLSVGGVADRRDVRPGAAQSLGAKLRSGSVAGIDENAKPLETDRHAARQPIEIEQGERRVRLRRDRGRGAGFEGGVLQEHLFERLLLGIGPLAAVAAENLDPVVLPGIVRRGDGDSRARPELQDDLRDARRRDHSRRGDLSAAFPDSGGELGHDSSCRLARVAADDGAPPVRSREAASELAADAANGNRVERKLARLPAQAVGAEELHRRLFGVGVEAAGES